MNIKIDRQSEAEMVSLAKAIANVIKPGMIISLSGNLGAGKTVFARGFMQALGHDGHVKSPTYTIVEPYTLSGMAIYHFDLYRVADPSELDYLGLDDYFAAETICLVEWPEKGAGRLPQSDIECVIDIDGANRHVSIMSHTEKGERVLSDVDQTSY